MMKKYFAVAAVILLSALTVVAQQGRTELLERLEQGSQVQQQQVKGVTKGALRLFGEKDDLTSVIILVPNGTEVGILERDGDYLLVTFGEYSGYLFSDKVEIKASLQAVQQQAVQQQAVQQQQISQENRLTYLEHKYGRNIASRIYAGKIWKGMTPEMITDAWGEPDRVNRVVVNRVQNEEWIYRSTWLLIEQGKLREWGPVGR